MSDDTTRDTAGARPAATGSNVLTAELEALTLAAYDQPLIAGIPGLDALLSALLGQLVDALAGAWCRRDPLDVLSDPESWDAKYAAGKLVLRAQQSEQLSLSRAEAKALRRLLLERAAAKSSAELVALRDAGRELHVPDYSLI